MDREGVPLACLPSSANRHDSKLPGPPLDAVPLEPGPRGRPRRRPERLRADKACDHGFRRDACRERGVAPRIARRGIESSERLGRHRWRVEQTVAHLKPYRRLAVRWERKAELRLAMLTLACAAIAARRLLSWLGS